MFALWCITFFLFQDVPSPYLPLAESIPEEVWQLRADPEKHIQDAIYVKYVSRIRNKEIDTYQMVRILSGQGKAFFSNILLNKNLTHLKGRVVDVSGAEVVLDSKKDLSKVLHFQYEGVKKSHILLIPAGLTPDCVLELSWSEKAEFGVPLDSAGKEYPIPEAFYCLEKRFEVDNTTLFQFSRPSDDALSLATRLRWQPIAPPATMQTGSMGDYNTLRFQNIPALRTFPFGDPRRDRTMAMVQVFRTLPYDGIPVNTFWKGYAQFILRMLYGNTWQVDRAYGDWLKDMRNKLPGRSNASAALLFQAFQKQFTRVDLMTHEQRKSINTAELEHPPLLADMLNDISDLGYIYPDQAAILLYETMVDLGFKPYLMFPPELEVGNTFQPSDMNYSQIDMFHPLIGLKEGDGWMTFAPAYPEYEAGQLPSRYRDVPLLVTNPEQNFEVSFVQLKRPSWKQNQLLETYVLHLDDTGTLQFSVSERNLGVFNAELRAKYRYLDAEEQAELYLADWQSRLPQWRLSAAQVEGVVDYHAKIGRRLKGIQTCNSQGPIWLNPFPGSQPLLDIPKEWPKGRTQPVLLPDHRAHFSRCTLHLPAGWTVTGNPSWSQANEVGKVSFRVVQEGASWVVERSAIIEKGFLDDKDEMVFRTFLSWLLDSHTQQLVVERRVK